MTRHRKRLSGIISFISQGTGMKRDRKRVFHRNLIELEEEENGVSSCLFRSGEMLDFNLVPSFPNYFYAFVSLLLPAHIPETPCLIYPEFLEPTSNFPKRIGMAALRLVPGGLCIILVLTFSLLELNAVFKNTYMEEKELFNYILLPNYVLPVLMRGQLLNILMRKRKSILKVFSNPKSFGCLNESLLNNMDEKKASRASKTFVYGFIIIGIIVVAFGDIGLSDWTLFELLEVNAEYIKEELIFRATTENNFTATSSSLNASEEGIQLETVVFGITGCFLNLLSFLTSIYIGGTFLFAGLTMKEVSNNLIRLTKAPRKSGQRILQSYEFMFQSTIRLNNDIGGLLALFHIQTFMFFVLFLRSTIAKGEILDIYLYACYIPNIAVTVAAYYYAALTPVMMDKFRTWVRKRDSKEYLGVNQDTIIILLDEMNTDPNGIGKGVFYVNADLIAKICSSIGAFFLVVAPSRTKSNQL